MNLNKILALTLMALLTACASTQEKEAQTAKEDIFSGLNLAPDASLSAQLAALKTAGILIA